MRCIKCSPNNGCSGYPNAQTVIFTACALRSKRPSEADYSPYHKAHHHAEYHGTMDIHVMHGSCVLLKMLLKWNPVQQAVDYCGGPMQWAESYHIWKLLRSLLKKVQIITCMEVKTKPICHTNQQQKNNTSQLHA